MCGPSPSEAIGIVVGRGTFSSPRLPESLLKCLVLAQFCIQRVTLKVYRPRKTIVVYLVHLVSLVCLVSLVSLVQPNKQDKPNKPDRPNRPNEQDRLTDFSSSLLEINPSRCVDNKGPQC